MRYAVSLPDVSSVPTPTPTRCALSPAGTEGANLLIMLCLTLLRPSPEMSLEILAGIVVNSSLFVVLGACKTTVREG